VAIEEARRRFETAKERHSKGEISDRELALANRELVIAEARGDELAIAKAEYDFLAWDYRDVAKRDPNNGPAIYKAEQDLNKSQHEIELAKAGTNELHKALADLKHAERTLGSAQRHRNRNFVSSDALKKLENDYFYADLHYKRLKQKQETSQ
jgi:hypothetical protein